MIFERNITIVPEIEMPGHASAAIAAYPWLGTIGELKFLPRPPIFRGSHHTIQLIIRIMQLASPVGIWGESNSTLSVNIDAAKRALKDFQEDPSNFMDAPEDTRPSEEWVVGKLEQKHAALYEKVQVERAEKEQKRKRQQRKVRQKDAGGS